MPHRLRAARHARDLARHHRATEQRDDPLQRPHPTRGLRAERRRAPAHRLGPGKRPHDRRDRRRQHLRRLAPRHFGHREQHALALGQLLAGQPGLAHKPFQRLRRRRRARPLHFLAHRLGSLGQVIRDQRQATRRGIGRDPRRGDPGLRQFPDEQLGQILTGLGLHPRRDFLAAQFEQKIGHATHPGYFACHVGVCVSMNFAQLAFARSRTRPI